MNKNYELENIPGCPLKIQTLGDLQMLITCVDKMKICNAGPRVTTYPNVKTHLAVMDGARWRHIDCCGIVGINNICVKCHSLYATLSRKANYRAKQGSPKLRNTVTGSPRTKNIFDRLKAAKKKTYLANRRAQKQLISLKAKIKLLQERCATITQETLEEQIKKSNLPEQQISLLEQCLQAGKVASASGRRYTHQFLMLCFLLHIKSPKAYNFLRDSDVLPLPCTRTIRNYLSRMPMKTGFDENHFKMLEKKAATLSEREKHGILMFDEAATRKASYLDVKTMTMIGLGDNVQNPTLDDLANNALVFMYRSLGGAFTQPVAIFGAKGPTNGVTLSKLILEAIVLLEKAGLHVDGTVCDGASTNRRMWTELGISGTLDKTQNSFPHPLDCKRDIYVISDVPHLFKCIRNRLLNKGILRVRKYAITKQNSVM
jgi:hypothetical protein